MIRDDDLTWARNWADSGVAPHGVLARLVLHVHEQEQQPEEDFATRITRASMESFEAKHGPMPPLSPPPEAVEWAQMVVRDAEENGYGPSPLAAFSEQEVISARFILTAAGKDTDDE